MLKAAGIIFSNLHGVSLPELTSKRTMASVPFGCRYRLIDFSLSNMANSGISKIGVVVHDNYHSLMNHIGTGKDWDLARRSGGIKILPPFITAFGNSGAKSLYTTRLEAMVGISEFISHCSEDMIVFSDCDIVCNMDLSDVLREHEKNEADITLVTTENEFTHTSDPYETYSVSVDGDQRVTDIALSTANNAGKHISTNIMVVNRVYLLSIIDDALSHGYNDFYRDILSKALTSRRVFAYDYKGHILRISSLESYYSASMSLLSEEVRDSIINVDGRPVYTKVRNSAPTLYHSGSSIKNSYIADGCEIEGTVENSIIFRGAKISRGAVVKNSIIMQDTYVGEKAVLNCTIADKDVTIKAGRMLSGHSSMPFYISKGAIV